jgi:hypothetical protein
MTAMTPDQKVQLGAEIRRVREMKPRISRQAIVDASESTLSENTVLAVERGEAIDSSFEKVLAAMRRLGRDVQVVAADAEQPVGASDSPWEMPDSSQLVGDLVAAILRAAPAEERENLRRNIWLLVRGQHAELIERLSRTDR